MNKRVIFILVTCLALIGVVLWLTDSPSEAEMAAAKRRQISTRWLPEYGIQSKDPRGIAFFNELIRTHTNDSVYILDRWSQLQNIPRHDSATYIFIGEGFQLADYEYSQLEEYVDSGATMFLCFDLTSDNIYNRYFEQNAYLWEYSDKLYVAMGDTSLAYYSVFQNDTIQSDWYTFYPYMLKDTVIQPFAWAMDNPIAYELAKNKGKIVMHSIPRLFANYQVVSPNGFAHAEVMLRRIPKNKPVIWLECGRHDFNYTYQDPGMDEEGDGKEKEDRSLIQFLMKNPSLRLAFLLAIGVLLLYVLFRAKRREAVLPGIPEKRNMSLAFVETLSSIYLSRRSPYSILLVLRKNFYMAINRHFYIDLLNTKNREEDERRLLEKASVDSEELKRMLRFLEQSKGVNEVTLSEAYRYIRRFYAETGIARPSSNFVEGKDEILVHRNIWIGASVLLLATLPLIYGLLLLTMSGGFGIVLVLVSLVLFYLGSRFLSKPLIRFTEDEVIYYRFFFGSVRFDLKQSITYAHLKGATRLFAEDGKQINIQHFWLSGKGKHALALFVEHLKHQSA